MQTISFDSLNQNNEKIKVLLAKMNDLTITEQEYQELQRILIEQYTIQEILLSLKYEGVNKDINFGNYPVCRLKVDANKLLFIADTHLGYNDENLDYLNEAYNFAIGNGIKTIIHAGDLIEGTSRNYPEINALEIDERYKRLQDEIIRAINLLPREVRTKLLIGNHDYSSFRTLPILIDSFFGKNNLEIMGMGRVVMDWNGLFPIELEHDINNYLFKNDLESKIFKIKGHSHHYYVDLARPLISLPTLSSDYRRWSTENEPLFIEAEMVDTTKVLFKEYKNEREKPVLDEEIEYDTKTLKMRFLRKSNRNV